MRASAWCAWQVTITPIQSSHLLPYVINNKSSFYWLRIRCSPVSTAAAVSPTSGSSSTGKQLERQLEELRLRRHGGQSVSRPTSTRAKLKRAARSFSDFFRGKSFSSRSSGSRGGSGSAGPGSDSAAGSADVDAAFYGDGTKPITVEPFIWNEFPLEVRALRVVRDVACGLAGGVRWWRGVAHETNATSCGSVVHNQPIRRVNRERTPCCLFARRWTRTRCHGFDCSKRPNQARPGSLRRRRRGKNKPSVSTAASCTTPSRRRAWCRRYRAPCFAPTTAATTCRKCVCTTCLLYTSPSPRDRG